MRRDDRSDTDHTELRSKAVERAQHFLSMWTCLTEDLLRSFRRQRCITICVSTAHKESFIQIYVVLKRFFIKIHVSFVLDRNLQTFRFQFSDTGPSE
jgi:hypothetical protein